MPPRPLEIGPAGQATAHTIERTRTARGYSQRRLAARVTGRGRPMTFTALSRIERTVRRCDIDDLVAIAAALGIPPHALLAPAGEAEAGATYPTIPGFRNRGFSG
ncbi:helix-turn-helix domain-containing protein [Streptomyces laurentii]|uniref:helix-turn-helix domain-containing protein n=1 Tax=Streptomyces laurentii TaxID=39478 RepID=UPI0033F2FFF5